jgi:hypothetical protein
VESTLVVGVLVRPIVGTELSVTTPDVTESDVTTVLIVAEDDTTPTVVLLTVALVLLNAVNVDF